MWQPTACGVCFRALVTMTTVGYGDAVPSTPAGKALGCLCMLSGILVLVFPVVLIGAAFDDNRLKYVSPLCIQCTATFDLYWELGPTPSLKFRS